MSLRHPDALAVHALDWIARLPLLGEGELAALLGVHEQDARAIRHELERRGWVDWIVPGEPGLEQRRLAYLREAALPAFAAAAGVAAKQLPSCVAARRGDVLERITRAEITAGVNRLFARIASGPRDLGDSELADARSLPLAGPAQARWWPPSVEGFGCLRSGRSWAPFFVAWDRAAAPDAHRRARVARWAATGLSVGRTPPILVVAPSERELAVWEDAIDRHDGALPADVLLATARDVLRGDPCGAMWREPRSERRVALTAALEWGAAQAVAAPRLRSGSELTSLARSGESLRQWAPRAAAGGTRSPRERTAAIAIATDAFEKRLVEWVAYHPLLTGEELAFFVGETRAAVERRLEWLTRCGALCTVPDARGSGDLCHILIEHGLRLLADRAFVPLSRFARLGGVTAAADRVDAASAVRHARHARGVNGAVLRLARDADRAGGRLLEWRNESASTRRFTQDDRTWFIRPDGSGVLALDGRRVPFIFEYDRGTLDAGDFAAKFQGYQRYFATSAWSEDFEDEPTVLFVCADDRAERRAATAVAREAPELPVVLTAEWRGIDAPAALGLLGSVWRTALDEKRRPLSPACGGDSTNNPVGPV